VNGKGEDGDEEMSDSPLLPSFSSWASSPHQRAL
jgi:hypothetical protein